MEGLGTSGGPGLARIAGAAVFAALSLPFLVRPLWVAGLLGIPAETTGEQINVRATWGGMLLGLAAFVLLCRGLRPWSHSIAWAVLTLMAGVLAARTLGFVLVEGRPGTLQWLWWVLELALVAGSAGYLIRAGALSPP